MPRSRQLQLVLTAAIGLWVVALFLTPAAIFPIGRYICHQRPERSFVVHGQQMPVCARCTGLYVGALVGAPLAAIAATALAGARARRLIAICALPTLTTWTLEFAGIASFSKAARFTAALPLGFAAAWLVLSVLAPSRPTPASIADGMIP